MGDKVIAKVGDTVRFNSPHGEDRIDVYYKTDGLHISRWGVLVIIPVGRNMVRLPFDTPLATEEARHGADTAPE